MLCRHILKGFLFDLALEITLIDSFFFFFFFFSKKCAATYQVCSEAVVCLLESASRAEKAAEAVQQFVRRGFDVMDGPVEFAICIDLFLSQEGLKLEGKGLYCADFNLTEGVSGLTGAWKRLGKGLLILLQ